MTGKQAELQGREGVIFALILFDLERGRGTGESAGKKRAVSGAAGGKKGGKPGKDKTGPGRKKQNNGCRKRCGR